MRGFGDFQRVQMRDADPRIPELFSHLRHAIELLEQIALQPLGPAAEPKRSTKIEAKPLRPSISTTNIKLSYSAKEVCKLVGISAATLYQVLGRRVLTLAEPKRRRDRLPIDTGNGRVMVELDLKKITAPDFTVSIRPGLPYLQVLDEARGLHRPALSG